MFSLVTVVSIGAAGFKDVYKDVAAAVVATEGVVLSRLLLELETWAWRDDE